MSIKIVTYILSTITCCLFFLPGCYIPFLKIPLVYFASFFVLTLLFFRDHEKFGLKLKWLFRYTPFQYLVYYYIYIIISTIILCFIGVESFKVFFKDALPVLFLYILPANLFSFYFVTSFNKKFYKLLKIMYLCTYITLCFGTFEIIAKVLNISFINIIKNIIVNCYVIKGFVDSSPVWDLRISSFHTEPTWYGIFLTISLPLILFYINNIKLSKYKSFNSIVKNTIIPLSIINIIFTQSPVWIIVFSIVLGYLTYKNILNFLKKNVLYIMLLCFLLLSFGMFLTQFNFKSNKVVSRICTTYESLGNMDKFASQEISLATRIISYINITNLVKKSPIIGIGFQNLPYVSYNQIINSPVILTTELLEKIKMYDGKYFILNTCWFFSTLSETGILGTILLYLYLFKILYFYKRNIKFIQQKKIKALFVAFLQFMILLIIFSFYDLRRNDAYIWFVLGCSYPFMQYIYKTNICIQKIKTIKKLKK